jgi:AcrR family transcriptional regulator
MTRKNILLAAAQIFSQKGYHATSMNDIANAVNLQKASLYHHVRNKQGILLSLLDEALDLVYNRIHAVLLEDLPVKDKLRKAIASYLSTLSDQHDLAAVLLLEHRSLDSEMRIQHLPKRDRFEQLWRDLLRLGVEEGIFNIDDINMATRALLGMMNWVVTWYREDGFLSIDEISSQFANLVLNGFLIR